MLHLRELARAALPPALVGIAVQYFQHFFPLNHQQLFLLAIISFGTVTWLLLTTFFVILRSFQTGGRPVNVGEFSRQALFFLPKIFVSYLAIFILVMGMLLVPWLLPVALFLLWAPLFCAGEIHARSDRKDDDDDDDDDEYIVRTPPKPVRYFSDRPLWDLGFARSINFTMKHLAVTIQVTILLAVSLILPKAAVVSIAGYYYGFTWVIVERLLSFVVSSLFFGVISATFLFLLPKEAHEEIGFPADTARALENMVKPLYQRGWTVLTILAGLALVGSWPVWHAIVKQNMKPPRAVVALEKFEQTPEQVILTLHLTDPEMRYRWFDPVGLRLVVRPAEGAAPVGSAPVGTAPVAAVGAGIGPDASGTPLNSPAPTAPPEQKSSAPDGERAGAAGAPGAVAKPASGVAEDGSAPKDPNAPFMLEPQRVMPYTAEGQPLPEENFAPYSGPIRLVVTFDNPAKSRELKGARYQLYYKPFFDRGEELPGGKGWGEQLVEGTLEHQ